MATRRPKASISKKRDVAPATAPRRKPKEGPRVLRAEVTVNAYEGYTLRWHSGTPIHEYDPYIDEISVYDDEQDEELGIVLDDTDLEFQIQENSEDSEEFTVSFEGTIEFTATPEQLAALEARGWSVDYCLSFRNSSGDEAESDLDFSLVENMNITLEVLPD